MTGNIYFTQSDTQGNPQNTNNEVQSHQPAVNNAHENGQLTPGEVFPTLLGNLGNHRHISFFNADISELPVIVYDAKLGFHTYSSSSSMVEQKLFTMHQDAHGHFHPPIRRAIDNQPVSMDMSVTSLVVFEWIAIVVVIFLFGWVGRKYKKNPTKAPSGFQNALESLVVYLRDEVVLPNVGTVKSAKTLLPYFIGLFSFILLCNLLGLVPGGHTATGALAVTGALAITAYFVINITAIKEAGIGHWLKHLLGGAPIWLCPIMIPIEIISMFVKPFALTIRLFANMTAGHVVLLSLIGLIFFFKLSNGLGVGLAITPISVGFSIFMYILELLVAFLQAYIFTTLTAVFVGLAIGEHAHEEHAH
ncbi:MAG: F0F1 ATP synthase subunit A [Ignavibacteriae bacterium]|nr:F0F1 ATP synthase subunit A [Ignavibacteriota bacterium]